MAHGSARPRSGMSGPAWSVASSQEQLHKMEKTSRRLGMEERCGGALATVSANSGEAQPWRAVVETAGGPHLRTIGSARRWGRSRRTRRSYGEGVVRVFAAVSKLCDGAVGAAMAERPELACCARWRRRNEKWADELVGQARGVFTSWPATPGWPRRVACASGDRRRVSPTRRTFSQKGQHCS